MKSWVKQAMSRYDIGIIGGLGPLASAVFMERLTNLEEASCDQDHLEAVLLSISSTPDRTDALLNGGADPTPYLQKALDDIVKLDCKAFCITCNTAHAFIPRLSIPNNIHFISLIDCALKVAFKDKKEALILSTKGTKKAGVYNKDNLNVIYPSSFNSDYLMSVIQKTKAVGYNEDSLTLLEVIIESEYKRNKHCSFVLACTELSIYYDELKRIYKDKNSDICIIDAMDELAKEVIRYSRHKVKE